MNEFLFFVLGLIIGGLTGIVSICILIINKFTDDNILQRYIGRHEKKSN